MQVNGVARPTQPKLAVPGHAKLVICDYVIEESFKFTKTYLGWEEVQLLDLTGSAP